MEDMEAVKAENHIFIDSRTATDKEGGLLTLAELLNAAREVAQ